MKFRKLGFPTEETMSSEAGLMNNQQYQDLRGVDWDTFDAIWDEEPEILTRIESGDDPYDAALETETMFLGVDPGVASTVAALLATGCATMTSCVGGAGHYEDHPLVVFWCPASLVEIVSAAADDAPGVTLDDNASTGLIVYSAPGDVAAMRAFAAALARRRRV